MEVKKGQIYINKKNVELKILKVIDNFNIRVEMLSGLNKGLKVNFSPDNLKDLFVLKG